MNGCAGTARARGFSMIEVLGTVVVMGVGLLGIMKMEATALASTASARMRALVSLQARSLASAMRGNPAFWADPALVAASFSANGTSVADAGGLFAAAAVDCRTASCTPTQLAAFDLRQWAADMNLHVPSYAATGTCAVVAATPVRCRLRVTWREKVLGVNSSGAATAVDDAAQSYVLLIEP